jgi:hypothetical protein
MQLTKRAMVRIPPLPCLESALTMFAAMDVLVFWTSRQPWTTAHLCRISTTAVNDGCTDIANVIDRVGLVFLFLGLARLYGSLYPKDKGAAEIALLSWLCELIFLLAEFQRYRENCFPGKDAIVDVLSVGMGLIVTFMLGWSYLHYKRKFFNDEAAAKEKPNILLVRLGSSSSPPKLAGNSE